MLFYFLTWFNQAQKVNTNLVASASCFTTTGFGVRFSASAMSKTHCSPITKRGSKVIMDYIKIKFGSHFDPTGQNLGKTMQEIFRTRAVNPMFSSRECMWTPQMDIYETPEEIMIWAEIAGVEKDDLDLEINSRAVKISGIRREMPRVPNGTYRLAEIQCGRFERVLYLPSPIDTEVVSSGYTNGLLTIRVAKLILDKVHQVPISEE